MIKHLVFLEIIDQQAASIICKGLKRLAKTVKCLAFEFHPCTSENGFNYFFQMNFKDATALDAYLQHPEHVELASKVIIPKLKKGLQSAVIVDYDEQTHKDICS